MLVPLNRERVYNQEAFVALYNSELAVTNVHSCTHLGIASAAKNTCESGRAAWADLVGNVVDC
jgi:hypothetical protein